MNVFEFRLEDDNDFELGTIKTNLDSETIENLFREAECDDLDEFVEYLIENRHDINAERLFIDETIYV